MKDTRTIGELSDLFAEAVRVDQMTMRVYARRLTEYGYVGRSDQPADESTAANLMAAWLAAPYSAKVRDAMREVAKMRAVSALWIEENAKEWLDYEEPLSKALPTVIPGSPFLEALASVIHCARPGGPPAFNYVRWLVMGEFVGTRTIWMPVAPIGHEHDGKSPGVVFADEPPIADLRAGRMRQSLAGSRAIQGETLTKIAEALGPLPEPVRMMA